MHPDDVAELVAEQVDELRRRVAERPELDVRGITLRDEVQLHVKFEHTRYGLAHYRKASAVVGPGGRTITARGAVPLLGHRTHETLILAMNCEQFDGMPPTAELLLPDGSPLPADRWPRDLVNRGIIADHPKYNRPHFCRRGLREYHDYIQHEHEPWDKYREALTLDDIALELLSDLQDRWIGAA